MLILSLPPPDWAWGKDRNEVAFFYSKTIFSFCRLGVGKMLLQAKRGRGEMRHLHGGNLQSTGTVSSTIDSFDTEGTETCNATRTVGPATSCTCVKCVYELTNTHFVLPLFS